MFKASFFAAFTFASIALATSLHPCTPMVRDFQPNQLNCVDKGYVYSIDVQSTEYGTIGECPSRPPVIQQKARIEMTQEKSGKKIAVLQILDGDFSYQMGMAGDGYFKSPRHGLDVQHCVSPMNGGFSVGN